MSMPQNAMQQMLMQKLAQGAVGPQSVGGGSGGPQMQGQIGAGNAAAQLAQKVMLMKALQNPPQSIAQHQANGMMPQTNSTMSSQMPQVNNQLQEGVNQTMAANPQIQAAGLPLTPQQIQGVDPSLMPPPGNS